VVAEDTAGASYAREYETELGVELNHSLLEAIERVRPILFLLQARPMTALPESVRWDPGAPGIWTRGIRLGEWLGDPVTPLFESWLLSRIETRFNGTFSRILGIPLSSPEHVVVNGWYFYGWNFLPTTTAGLLRVMLLQVLPRLIRRPRLVAGAFPPFARLGIAQAEREWRDEIQPRYRHQVQAAGAEVEAAKSDHLVALVDDLADGAGDYFASLARVGGYAARAQISLARLYREHLLGRIGGSHLDLLSGLGDQPPQPAGHAVHSLDWIEPTLGETGRLPDARVVAVRHAAARDRRLEAEARSRATLAAEPKLSRRFDGLLREAQRFGPIREEQAAELTLPWPVLRRAVLGLGATLVGSGALGDPAQVFFLTRAELIEALSEPAAAATLASLAVERRSTWERQRHLVPPLILGTVPGMFARILSDAEEAVRGPGAEVENGAVGIPASPGRATGPARIVRGLDDFDRIQRGDVLVAPLTAPAWTPLFDLVVAVVTDTGGVAAHASIVAREYGLPAVVGTGDGTARFHEGEVLEVDGSTGVVRRVI
jgi:phosphohistidine swiveling domain-containing protein